MMKMLKDIKKQNKKILSLLEQSESSTSSHHYLSTYKVCEIKASTFMSSPYSLLIMALTVSLRLVPVP